MKYKCGCEAGGDNVANYCPIHGDAEEKAEMTKPCAICAELFGDSVPVLLSSWKPIDSAPKDTDVLVCDKNGIMIVASLKPYGWELAESDDLWSSAPIFWMELPKAPEA